MWMDHADVVIWCRQIWSDSLLNLVKVHSAAVIWNGLPLNIRLSLTTHKFSGCRSTSLEWPSTWSMTAWTLLDDNWRPICSATAVHRDSYCRIICAIEIFSMYVCIYVCMYLQMPSENLSSEVHVATSTADSDLVSLPMLCALQMCI